MTISCCGQIREGLKLVCARNIEVALVRNSLLKVINTTTDKDSVAMDPNSLGMFREFNSIWDLKYSPCFLLSIKLIDMGLAFNESESIKVLVYIVKA